MLSLLLDVLAWIVQCGEEGELGEAKRVIDASMGLNQTKIVLRENEGERRKRKEPTRLK